MNKRRENGKFAIFWDAESMKKSEEKYFRLFFFVRRIGVTKPPVQLGVGKNTLV